MANPKHRHSKTRRDKRRTHWTLDPIGLVECPACHELKLPHRICPHCGEYKGRVIVAKKA